MDLEYRQFRNIDKVFVFMFILWLALIENDKGLLYVGGIGGLIFLGLYVVQDYIPYIMEFIKECKKSKGE